MKKKLKAKKIIEEIEKQLKKGDVVLSHCNIITTITGTRNYSFVFYQNNSEINYDYCDFIVTFNRFFDYKKCCVKMLQDFLPEIYGENAKPCRAMLFMKIMATYMNGSISSSTPYWAEWK